MTRFRFRLVPSVVLAGLVVGIALMAAQTVWAGGTAARYKALAERLIAAGQAALDSADYVRARMIFESAAAADPSNSEAFTLMARAYQGQGDLPRAKKFYATALEIDPLDERALGWSGELDVAASNTRSAQEKLARLERICGDCEPALRLKGLLAGTGPSAARESFERVSALSGNGE